MSSGPKQRSIWRSAADLLRGVIISGRPITSGIAGFLAGATVAFLPSTTWGAIIQAAFALICVTMAGFIVNDVHDRAKDAFRSVQRPITVGKLSVRAAIIASCLLITSAVLFTPTDGASLRIMISTAAGVILYSFVAHRFPSIKGLYTALLCCTPLMYGAAIGGGKFTLAIYAALVLFISGREIYLDVQDIDADSRFGLRTIPILFGDSVARSAAVGLMLIANGLTLFLVNSTFGYIAAGSSLAALCVILSWPKIDMPHRLMLTRIPMLLGALALASTV